VTELEQRLAAATAPADEQPLPDDRERLAEAARAARARETETRLALRTAEERARALAGRAESLRRAARSEQEARRRAAERQQRVRREGAVAEEVIGAARVLEDHLARALLAAAEERTRLDTERRSAEQLLVDARARVRTLGREHDELVGSAHRDELARAQQQMRLEQLRERAVEEVGLDGDALVAEYGPHVPVPVAGQPQGDGSSDPAGDPAGDPGTVPFDREQQRARLREAEKALAVLGRVNPLALEEFAALEERNRFLTDQLEDLRRTRKDLLDIVTEVDGRVEEVFTEAWRDVEVAFRHVFDRLFPGGEGRLVLTDPDDMLGTGIDVEARPPGKKVKRLSLLSGGERSLVAVAFLVALFKARPSPFYVLDEVEAALDDTNLGRLLDLYAELRATSQLIVITHQKRTMEIGDALYGVTMRGDGVSTVISQRLREREPA
jgi:chromosome segregation protein